MWWIILLLGLTYIPILIIERKIYTNQNSVQINVIYTFITSFFLLIYDLVLNPQNKNKKIKQIFKEYQQLLNKDNLFLFLVILGLIVSLRYFLYYKGFINNDVKGFLPILGISSIIITFLLGIFYFNEEWNCYNIIGIVLALVAIYLIHYKIKDKK